MRFRKIENDPRILQKIYTAFTTTFPEEERRTEQQFRQLSQSEKSSVLAVEDQNQFIGYLIVWDLAEAVFIEYFEIFEEYRNHGYGASILSEFSKIHPRLILESEPADRGEMARRRLGFYARNDFKIIKNDYLQPSYQKGGEKIRLCLLVNFPNPATEALVRQIYRIVYADL